jgi:hypothetical protein
METTASKLHLFVRLVYIIESLWSQRMSLATDVYIDVCAPAYHFTKF